MKERKPSSLPIVFVAIGLIFAAGIGCSPQQQAETIDQLKAARAATTQSITNTKASAETLQVQLDALPPDAPERKVLQPQLDKLNKAVAQIEARVPLLDAAIASAQSGHVDPALISGAAAIPGVGPYVALGLIIAGAAGTLYQNYRKRQEQQQKEGAQAAADQAQAEAELHSAALTQVVAGVEAVLPNKTDDQKLKLAAPQSPETKTLVAQAKANL